jgi:putative peptidoglycan lipid II flippase
MRFFRSPTSPLGASLIVGLSAALSRILGFLREILIAAVFGTSGIADALLIGLRLPNLLRRTLGEGGAQGAFVPWLLQAGSAHTADAARRRSGRLLVGLGLTALILCGAAIWGRAALTHLLAPGFSGPSSAFSLAEACLALAFPIVGASLLTAFATAWLAVKRAYVLASLSGLLVNLALIAVLFWVQSVGQADETAAQIVAGSMAVAGLGQVVLLFGVILRQDDAPTLAWPDGRMLADVAKRLLPSLTVAAAPQLAFVMVLMPATQWSGQASQLIYAERLLQLPFGFIAAGLALVALPELSRLHQYGAVEDFAAQCEQALLAGLALALPSAMGLALLAHPMILLLFARGAFGVTDAIATADVLQMISLALPVLVGTRVLGQIFFAQQFYHPPLLASLGGLLAAGLFAALARDGAELGLAYALAMAVDFVLLVIFAGRRRRLTWSRPQGLMVLKLLGCNGVLLAFLLSCQTFVPLWPLALADRALGFMAFCGEIAASLALYALSLAFCGLWAPLLAKKSHNHLA